ncbi:MAG: glycosyltransferase, partial [Elusimicrobia bacterium]|nr:glycosyltransferase [Elusimicrobiota bacterium]
AFLAACDVFVMTSRGEGNPIALLEAMAMQKPVVVTDFDGISEVLTHNVSGMIVPRHTHKAVADAVKTLIQDPGTADRIARAARDVVDRSFTVSHMVKRTEALYQQLLKTPNS